jgi:hypothetical protein
MDRYLGFVAKFNGARDITHFYSWLFNRSANLHPRFMPHVCRGFVLDALNQLAYGCFIQFAK